MEPPKRKPNRLKEYDYSQTGAYFITICTINREPILSTITVGDGSLDIQHRDASLDIQHRDAETYPRASSLAQAQFTLSSPTVQLSQYGKIVESALQSIHLDNVNLSVDTYVIMPDHIHFILTIAPIDIVVGDDVSASRDFQNTASRDFKNAASRNLNMSASHPPQTQIVPHVISWFKRLTHKQIGFPIWQRSYHDHIIRSEEEYHHIYQYIHDSPARWLHKYPPT